MADERTRLAHLVEQSSGILADIAPTLAAYFAKLVAEGIPPEQAIQLVRDIQTRYIGSPLRDPPDAR